VIFYFVCAIVGLFCAIALGLGPLLFVMLGVLLAVIGFRERRYRWWGLAGAGAGVGLMLGVLVGWGWKPVAISTAVGFVVPLVARTVGRAADRRGALGRR
jgi:hypothetical protein